MKPSIPKEKTPPRADKTDKEIMKTLALQQESHQHEQHQQKEQNQHDKEKLKIEIGYIGRLFGNHKHTTPNIVAITILACFCLIIVILIVLLFKGNKDASHTTDLNSIIVFLTSIISLAFGYIFGSSNK